jgi:hypothetical protein
MVQSSKQIQQFNQANPAIQASKSSNSTKQIQQFNQANPAIQPSKSSNSTKQIQQFEGRPRQRLILHN